MVQILHIHLRKTFHGIMILNTPLPVITVNNLNQKQLLLQRVHVHGNYLLMVRANWSVAVYHIVQHVMDFSILENAYWLSVAETAH